MKTTSSQCAALLAALVLLAMPVRAADPPKVLNVIAVTVKAGQQDAYLEKVKKLNAAAKRLEAASTIRVWRATMAGDTAGTIYVGIEYPNLESMAKAQVKMNADDEWQKLVKEMDTTGMREIVSNSLLVEITP